MPMNVTIYLPEGNHDEITLRLKIEFERPAETEPPPDDDESELAQLLRLLDEADDDIIGREEGPDDWDEGEYDDEHWDY